MPLQVGHRLGPYEVVAPLGVGGMGEVYRAQDVRLDREVALKVVAAHVGMTAEVRQRFEREAKAIAALSHPNICTLFDVGCHDGSDYLVMELLEGESLDDRLVRGPVPLDLALRWGAQILAALARAHRGGIVHRDLKPANIMITPSGVKLLDFGLAQLRSEIPAVAESISVAPTRVAPLTGDGAVLGTLQYMAPEQLEGRTVDARSDLFAFGALLYEMVTGTMAFPGTSMASVISSILRDQPPPLTERNSLAPRGLERLVARCLAKDPEERWQSAHDLRLQLEGLAAEGSSPAARHVPDGSRRTWRLGAVMLGGLLVAVLVAAWVAGTAGGWWSSQPETSRPTEVRFELPPPEGSMFRGTVETVHVAVSPDGREVAFLALPSASTGSSDQGAIWLRSLSSEVPRKLAGSEGARSIFWSPQGDEIGFFASGRLKRQAITPGAGAPVVICEVSEGIGLAGTWGRDAIVFGSIQGEILYRVDVVGGEPEPLIVADPSTDQYRVQWPWFQPDGVGLLYLSTDGQGDSHLMQIPAGGAPRKVAPIRSRVEMLAPDVLVFSIDGALFAQTFDADAGRLVAAPMPIAPSVATFDPTKHAAFAASLGGTIVVSGGVDDSYLAWFDQQGREMQRVGDTGSRMTVAISADGRRALSELFHLGRASFDISLIDLERGIESLIVATPMTEVFPVWMPGDRSFLYTAARGRPPQLMRRDLDSVESVQLLDEPSFQIPVAALSDGRLLFRRRTHQTGFGLFSMSLQGRLGSASGAPELVEILPASSQVSSVRVSPDEQLMAYVASKSGSLEAYLRPVDGAATIRVSSAGARSVGWNVDGTELLFTTPDARLFAAIVETTPALSVVRTEERFILPALGWASFDVAPDDRILAIVETAHRNSLPLTVVVGWSAER